MHDSIVVSAVSHERDARLAAQALAAQLSGQKLAVVLFFCSAEYDLQQLSDALRQIFNDTLVVGCTSAGEITPFGYGRGCITAVGFAASHFSVAGVLIDRMETFSLHDAQQVVNRLLRDGRGQQKHSFALTLLDGLSSREEVVLAALSAALGGIPHFGGSAGDDNQLTRTDVYFDGRFHTAAAVVVLFSTPLEFEVFTTHHLLPSSEKLVVTAVDADSRRVLELNAEPAALAYARLLGCAVEELDMHLFASHPLAVKMGNSYYPRAIQKAHPDHSLTFYCAVENGIVLTAMKSASLEDNLNRLFDDLQQRFGSLLLTVGCDCFLRRLEAESIGVEARVEQLLRQHQVIGFNTYGEQFNGMHVNQTFTGVAIGNPRSR